MRSLYGSSGDIISLSLKSLPLSSGQNDGGMVPFGLNMMMSRCRGRAGLARLRLGKPIRNGKEAAEMPRCLMNWRRSTAFIVGTILRWALFDNRDAGGIRSGE